MRFLAVFFQKANDTHIYYTCIYVVHDSTSRVGCKFNYEYKLPEFPKWKFFLKITCRSKYPLASDLAGHMAQSKVAQKLADLHEKPAIFLLHPGLAVVAPAVVLGVDTVLRLHRVAVKIMGLLCMRLPSQVHVPGPGLPVVNPHPPAGEPARQDHVVRALAVPEQGSPVVAIAVVAAMAAPQREVPPPEVAVDGVEADQGQRDGTMCQLRVRRNVIVVELDGGGSLVGEAGLLAGEEDGGGPPALI